MSSRIYVGHLDQRTRESDVEKFFRSYGRIREISMKTGFAFVEFEDYRDADDAVHELNGKELLGSRLLVEFTRGMPRGRGERGGGYGDGGRGGGYRDGRDGRDGYRSGPRSGHGGRSPPIRGGGVSARTPHRLAVDNLSSSVSWQDLKDFMRQAGEVVFTDVFPKRNEGVVEFASATDLRNAMSKLDGKELNGRKIRLEEEKYKSSYGGGGNDRRRSRSRSPRSRSVSKSRSRTPPPKRRRSTSHSRSRSNPRSGSDRKSSKEKNSSSSKKRSVSPGADTGNGEKKSKQRKSGSGSGSE